METLGNNYLKKEGSLPFFKSNIIIKKVLWEQFNLKYVVWNTNGAFQMKKKQTNMACFKWNKGPCEFFTIESVCEIFKGDLNILVEIWGNWWLWEERCEVLTISRKNSQQLLLKCRLSSYFICNCFRRRTSDNFNTLISDAYYQVGITFKKLW